jgi:SAM-dependent methyltransferase
MSRLRDRIPGPLRALLRPIINHVPIYSRAQIRKNQEQLGALENQLRQTQIMIDELSITVRDLGGLVPPPMKLQTRIVSRRLEGFFTDAAAMVREFERILGDTGGSLKSFDSILDFGSGCARIARPLRDFVGPGVNLYATDIDREAVDWCRQNYAAVADFEVNDPWPPLKYEDSRFDFIYGFSVFTHLPEEMQVKWLQELNRILKPEGYLILTTHGEAYHEHLSGGTGNKRVSLLQQRSHARAAGLLPDDFSYA